MRLIGYVPIKNESMYTTISDKLNVKVSGNTYLSYAHDQVSTREAFNFQNK